MTKQEALYSYCVRIGDSALIHAQRLCEWCGHGPILEEDIAMSNIGLDLIGQARGFYTYAAELEGKGRTEDDIAFLRDEREFTNCCMVEQPNCDFGYTMARTFLHGCFAYLHYRSLLNSADETIAGLAAKSIKEATYHVRHSGEWLVRLGDGTEESHRRVQDALDELWQFTDELFDMDEVDALLIREGVATDLSALRSEWDSMVNEVLSRAKLQRPQGGYRSKGGMHGLHTEHLGHMLSEMQILPRTYPGAKW